ncbi:hypothetical protein CS0771_68800 [Catellatospora sp. IY07-71]|uniref:hypothetical protein n=1 Tax=Catellatospora sp. IY07-71 TaxID=2728827 RepID=UPI001BB3F9F9|nr:hypothetical protein [Catellatospora sp. IY07-71]BCJ77336.1 hypothetical protein CS0771_68800 [Catellatospora sp. IY07-71]
MDLGNVMEFAAIAVLVGVPVVGAVRGATPSARARRRRERARRKEIMARQRQSTLTHPVAPGRTALRLLFILLGLALFRMVLRNGVDGETGSPGFWLPLCYTVGGVTLVVAGLVPLALGLLDHAMRRSFRGRVVDTIEDVYESGDGEGGSSLMRVPYVVVEGDGCPRRPYRVTDWVMGRVRVGEAVQMTIAPHSGYVYELRQDRQA